MVKKYILELLRVRSLDDLIKLVLKILRNEKIRFLVVGALNTLICYLLGLIYFSFLKADVITITIFNIIVTLNSFLMHKFISFNKKKYNFKEIVRAIISYGSMYIISIYVIMGLISIGYSQMLAYHINLVISIMLFYFIHSKFTFK